MSIISAHRLFGMSTVVTFMAALFALPSDAQLQCGAEYDRIAAKMASSSGEVTDSEISFALDCERAAAGKGKDPGTIAKPQNVYQDEIRVRDLEKMQSGERTNAIAQRGTKDGIDAYWLGTNITPEVEFAYDTVAPGTRWVPELGWQRGTRVVKPFDKYLLNTDVFGDGTPTITQAVKDNRLAELLPIYAEYARRPDTRGEMAVTLAYFIRRGQGGVSSDLATAEQWLRIGAQKTPEAYLWLGELYENGTDKNGYGDAVRAAEIYAEGLSRGCRECIRFFRRNNNDPTRYPDVTVSDEDYFRYLVFAADLGQYNAMRWLAEFLDDQYQNRGGSSNTFVSRLGLTVKTRKNVPNPDTINSSSADTMLLSGELGSQLRSRYRTGFVPQPCVEVVEAVERNDLMDALDKMTDPNGCWGRYQPSAMDVLLLMDVPEDKVGDRGMAFFTGRSLIEGDLNYASTAAARYMGVGSLELEGGKLVAQRNGSYGPYVRAMLEPARRAGYISDVEAQRMIGIAYAEGAEGCLEDAGVRSLDDYNKSTLSHCRSQLRMAQSYGMSSSGEYTQRVYGLQRDSERRAAAAEAERLRSQRAHARSRNYEPATSVGRGGTAPEIPGTISSAEASRRAKANMCSGSLGSTDFCQ